MTKKKLIEEIRKAFAEYKATEGCSCCQDIAGHTLAEERLAELLQPNKYSDLSGWDWGKENNPK